MKLFLRKSIFIVVIIVLLLWQTQMLFAQTTNTINIDFATPVRQISPLAFSMDVSGYGQGSYITNDTVHKQRIANLKLGMLRMHLAYQTLGDPTSPIVCHGSGCATSVSGDNWVTGIKTTGAEPVLIITVSGTHTTLQDQTDAVNLVKHFNKDTNNPVKRWIIGNELDNSGNPDHMDATTYSNRFNALYDAMKATDPSIKIGGPATAYYDTNFIDTFLTISGNKTDFIDFHTYGQGGTENKSEATLLSETTKYTTDLTDLQNRINQKVPSRANTIEMQIGEWNLDWNSDPKQYTHFNTIWAATVLGKIIQAGGYSMQFADKNGALGALYETTGNGGTKNDPMPIYHAYGMFTGEGLFPHFGTTLVKVMNTNTNLEVFASDNPKSIVIINKNPTTSQQASINLAGITNGSITIWQKDTTLSAIAAPKNSGTQTITNGTIAYTFPAYSVTTFVISPSGTQTTPTPSIQPAQLQTTILLHGIGKSGDNTNPQGGGNMTPTHTSRQATVELLDATNQLAQTRTISIAYGNTNGTFTGTIPLDGLQTGAYTIRITVPHYLKKVVPGIVAITAGQPGVLPPVALTTGDSNNDNALSILDYNLLLDCFSDLFPAKNCNDTNKKQATDATDDGIVNQFDYNLFLRELSVQQGQ